MILIIIIDYLRFYKTGYYITTFKNYKTGIFIKNF